jgi:anti-sigma B factor antagonist
MEYHHKLEDQIAIFTLEGNLLKEDERENIKQDLEQYLAQNVSRFLIDLTNLKHINSTGLGIFITLYTKVRNMDGELVICNPSDNIYNLLKITKLHTVFTFADSVQEGLEKLKAVS